MKLIINADDFGYSRGVNHGIIDAYRFGVVTSTTLMVNMPGTEHALGLARDNQELGVGVHLVLTSGKPISDTKMIPSLVTSNGEFHHRNDIFRFAEIKDIKMELYAQVERFNSFGIMPTHIDSHHHVHVNPKVLSIVEELAIHYNLPVRNIRNNRIKSTDAFEKRFKGNGADFDGLTSIITENLNYESLEIMCHPGYMDLELYEGSSYTWERMKELDVLTDQRIQAFLKSNEVSLISYKQL